VSLTFFADHCAPNSVVRALRRAGHEVLLLRDHLPADAPDPNVIAKAQELDAILLSLNGDFADIVTYPPGSFGGIVAFQVRDHPESIPQLTEALIHQAAGQPSRDYYRGKLLVVEAHRIRIRS
jgi:predicted nuclease of predicted toxin-antitoxin system